MQVPYIFKASYDKANRTSINSFRGPGLMDGLRILRKVDETSQSSQCLPTCMRRLMFLKLPPSLDILQIPAFLCRQTDLLVAAGATRPRGEH